VQTRAELDLIDASERDLGQFKLADFEFSDYRLIGSSLKWVDSADFAELEVGRF
jgi:hypothetical protein